MVARKYKAPKCSYKVVDGHIETDCTVMGKMTGTMIGAISNLSPWSTPFQTACRILGVGVEDIDGKPAVEAGKLLETTVLNYAGERFPELGTFLPAEEVYEKREGDHASWESDFEDDYFAGHVDGIVMSDEGENYILEIKTSSNMDMWADGVPSHYYWQVALYDYFITKKGRAYVVLGVMDDEARRNPATWVPTDENVMMFPVDIDLDLVGQALDKLREWYDKYIMTGTTPDYDPSNPGDVELYNHLVTLASEEESIEDLVDKLADTEKKIHEYEAAKQSLYDKRDELHARIKDYMDGHDLVSIDSASGAFVADYRTSKRKKIDKYRMIEAGLNPDDYSTETIVKTLSIKLKKE